MRDLHNVEIAKTEHGETVLLDDKEIKGLKDFTLIRKANNLAVLHLELYVGEVNAVDVRAKSAAREFEKWVEQFNKRFEIKLELDGKEIAKAIEKSCCDAYSKVGVSAFI